MPCKYSFMRENVANTHLCCGCWGDFLSEVMPASDALISLLFMKLPGACQHLNSLGKHAPTVNFTVPHLPAPPFPGLYDHDATANNADELHFIGLHSYNKI